MPFLRQWVDSVSLSTISQKLLRALAVTHIHADAHVNLCRSLSCRTRDGHADKTVSLFLLHGHANTRAREHTPTIKFSNELPLSNEAQRRVYITPAWHDPSADIITTWWGVVMTHEQRTFGASPKYDTIIITHITCGYDDFAIMALSYLQSFSSMLSSLL